MFCQFIQLLSEIMFFFKMKAQERQHVCLKHLCYLKLCFYHACKSCLMLALVLACWEIRVEEKEEKAGKTRSRRVPGRKHKL